jgi:hypothetical protein
LAAATECQPGGTGPVFAIRTDTNPICSFFGARDEDAKRSQFEWEVRRWNDSWFGCT